MKKNIVLKLLIILYIFSLSIYANEQKTITAVIPKHFPPQHSLDKNGKPTGFAIDTLNEIAKNINYKVNYIVKNNWPEVNKYILDNKADIIPNMGITQKRGKYLLFTDPLESFNIGVYSRSTNNNIKNYKNLNGKKLGVVSFNIGVKLSKQFDKSEVVIYKTKEEMFYALISADIDFVIYPIPIFKKMISDANLENSIIQIGMPIKEIKRAIAVNKNNIELYNILSPEVKEFIKTKKYEQIYTKWYGEKKNQWSQKTVITVISILVIFFIIVLFLSKYYFTKKLNAKLSKELEERIVEIKQKDELLITQARQAGIGETLEMISHQWRQPLSIIQMSVNNLQADINLDVEITRKELDSLISTISKQTDTLSKIVETFRTYSIPSNTKELVIVCDVIKEVINIVEKNLFDNGIKIRCIKKSKKEINIVKSELIEVLINIINNAKETMIKRAISKGVINISVESDENYLTIGISDNAGGISQNDILHIAKAYYTTKSLNGSGLGLYISRIIIERHQNGKLSWKNQDNGACFNIRLPLIKKVKYA